LLLSLVHQKGKGSWICIVPHCEKLASEVTPGACQQLISEWWL